MESTVDDRWLGCRKGRYLAAVINLFLNVTHSTVKLYLAKIGNSRAFEVFYDIWFVLDAVSPLLAAVIRMLLEPPLAITADVKFKSPKWTFHPRCRMITSLAILSAVPAVRADLSYANDSMDASGIVLSSGKGSRILLDEPGVTNITAFNPETYFRECGIQDHQKEGIICMGSFGDAHWICPLNNHFQGPPFSELVNTTYWGNDFSYNPCFYCPAQQPIYGQTCRTSVENIMRSLAINEESATLLEKLCVQMCEGGLEGDKCSDKEPCAKPSHFCDFSDRSEKYETGVCRQCPSTVDACYEESFLLSEPGRSDCIHCQIQCDDVGYSNLLVNGEEIRSDYMHYAIQDSFQRASGSIVDCSQLVLDKVEDCDGAEGKVCFVSDFTKDAYHFEVSNKAEASGCTAIIFSGSHLVGYGCGYHSFDDLSIPFVCVSYEDGQRISGNHIGKYATVEVEITGQACVNHMSYGTPCTKQALCTSENEFCPFDRKVFDSEKVGGWCWPCPLDERGDPDPLFCYFDVESGVYPRTPEFVKNCVDSCNAQLQFQNCKFCPKNLNPIEFGIEHQSEKCSFCPNQDLEYPDRLVPFFADNVTCWQMQSFYEYIDIHKDSQNCLLAQNMNFICGCEGIGYAGASTKTKQAALAWTPRVMAILSIMGSLFIVFDTTKTIHKRSKLLNQMLCTISVFDILGSIAYSLTTFPIPDSYYVYGSRGNDKTCTAQGFFIQIGSIACLLNVPLAVYYSKSIKHGWRDEKLKSKRLWLLAPPVILGLTIALILIPHYDNMFLWCNNMARYWPEIPIILSITSTTVIMGDICIHVYKQTKSTARYSTSRNISSTVFKQACLFTGAFYFTWVPYIALQYMWSSGKYFSNYGVILYAAMTVPMQGFCNCLVYVRPRYKERIYESVSTLAESISRRLSYQREQPTTPTQNKKSKGENEK